MIPRVAASNGPAQFLWAASGCPRTSRQTSRAALATAARTTLMRAHDAVREQKQQVGQQQHDHHWQHGRRGFHVEHSFPSLGVGSGGKSAGSKRGVVVGVYAGNRLTPAAERFDEHTGGLLRRAIEGRAALKLAEVQTLIAPVAGLATGDGGDGDAGGIDQVALVGLGKDPKKKKASSTSLADADDDDDDNDEGGASSKAGTVAVHPVFADGHDELGRPERYGLDGYDHLPENVRSAAGAGVNALRATGCGEILVEDMNNAQGT